MGSGKARTKDEGAGRVVLRRARWLPVFGRLRAPAGGAHAVVVPWWGKQGERPSRQDRLKISGLGWGPPAARDTRGGDGTDPGRKGGKCGNGEH